MLRHRFRRFAESPLLHFAAPSHNYWPDVAFSAHQQAWLAAAEYVDDKWDVVFGTVLPEARSNVGALLGLPDPETVVFAPNTHEFVVWVASCLPRPFHLVTSDGEFHSFRRQAARWAEAGVADVTRVASEPFDTFATRFADAVSPGAALVYVGHVFYDSGYYEAARATAAYAVIDGYHTVMALPVDLSSHADRVFYLGGGYKYAMAGEGACFMHCPPGWGERPVDTGWYAGFGSLTDTGSDVEYETDGSRFFGATFDPSGLYRFNAVQAMLREEAVSVADIHAHVRGMQQYFVGEMGSAVGPLEASMLHPGWSGEERGHFLTFRTPNAGDIRAALRARGVMTDHRGDRFRIGFAVYHDDADVERLLAELASLG